MWLWGAVGGLAAYRLLTRRRGPEPALEPAGDPRAEELRRRLDESRLLVEEREEFESGETPVDRAEPVPGEVDARRRLVHEQGRAAVDRMRRKPPS